MGDSGARYVGTWDLVPELSLYAAGSPPAAGRYEVTRDDSSRLNLRVTWRMSGDTEERSTEFGGIPDGKPIVLPAAPNAPDAFTLTHIDADTLDSAAMLGETVIAYARRVVSADGTLMAVVQEAGGKRNFQVYRRTR